MKAVTAVQGEHSRPAQHEFADALQKQLRRVIELHFNPETGSPYWLRRQKILGIDVLDEVRGLDDLYKLGRMDDASLRGVSVEELISRALRLQKHRLILGDSAGSTGTPKVVAYAEEDFRRAFVDPFVGAATAMNFPRGENWLFIGPSGPHIIGKAARVCARELGSMDPFMVDLDPRWIRKMKPDSMGHKRYLEHVIQQALDVLSSQDVGVLFSTPAVLAPLARRMTEEQRLRIRGVHYGGIALTLPLYTELRNEMFPNAVHMSGYGNTLFGMCPELIDDEPRPIDYYPHGTRLVIRLIPICRGGAAYPERLRESVAYGERGQIMFHRLDPSGLIVNMCERDSAERLPPPTHLGKLGFFQDGLRCPEPLPELKKRLRAGLY